MLRARKWSDPRVRPLEKEGRKERLRNLWSPIEGLIYWFQIYHVSLNLCRLICLFCKKILISLCFVVSLEISLLLVIFTKDLEKRDKLNFKTIYRNHFHSQTRSFNWWKSQLIFLIKVWELSIILREYVFLIQIRTNIQNYSMWKIIRVHAWYKRLLLSSSSYFLVINVKD